MHFFIKNIFPLQLILGIIDLSFPDAFWKAGSVFVIAAAPWLELWVAIPFGIILGLSPAAAFSLGVIGNFLSLLVLYLLYKMIKQWVSRRFSSPKNPESKRKLRFQRIWKRWGLPGVSLAAPFFIGTHFTILLVLLLGTRGYKALSWMGLSLIVWGAGIVLAVIYGMEIFSYPSSFLSQY